MRAAVARLEAEEAKQVQKPPAAAVPAGVTPEPNRTPTSSEAATSRELPTPTRPEATRTAAPQGPATPDRSGGATEGHRTSGKVPSALPPDPEQRRGAALVRRTSVRQRRGCRAGRPLCEHGSPAGMLRIQAPCTWISGAESCRPHRRLGRTGRHWRGSESSASADAPFHSPVILLQMLLSGMNCDGAPHRSRRRHSVFSATRKGAPGARTGGQRFSKAHPGHAGMRPRQATGREAHRGRRCLYWRRALGRQTRAGAVPARSPLWRPSKPRRTASQCGSRSAGSLASGASRSSAGRSSIYAPRTRSKPMASRPSVASPTQQRFASESRKGRCRLHPPADRHRFRQEGGQKLGLHESQHPVRRSENQPGRDRPCHP
jgi:hypothetical protein